jgi:hypothetical protein
MGGGGKTTTTNVNKTELPAWVNNAGKSNYDESVRIGGLPQYSGTRVADFTPTMTQALSYIKDNAGAGSVATSQAGSIFSDMNDPSKVQSRVSSYMNPWLDEVESKSLGALEDQRLQAISTNADAATKARAFGGDRASVVDAITNSEATKNAGLLSSALRKEGYDTAMTNQRADSMSAGQGLLSTGDQQTSNYLKTIQALMSGANVDQSMAQSKLDDTVQQFESPRNQAIDDLNLRMQALGMAPYNTSTSGTSTTKTPSTFDPAQLIMGMLSFGLGL